MASLEEAAAHVFISAATFTKLRREGKLPSPKGRAGYVLDDVRRAYIEGLKNGNAENVSEAGPMTAERQKYADDYSSARARQAKALADKLELENKLRRGELAPIEILQAALEQVAARTRPALESLPAQLKREIPHLRATELAVARRLVVHVSDEIADVRLDA